MTYGHFKEIQDGRQRSKLAAKNGKEKCHAKFEQNWIWTEACQMYVVGWLVGWPAGWLWKTDNNATLWPILQAEKLCETWGLKWLQRSVCLRTTLHYVQHFIFLSLLHLLLFTHFDVLLYKLNVFCVYITKNLAPFACPFLVGSFAQVTYYDSLCV